MLGGGGTIDMSRISAFALTSYGVEKSVLLSIPYTFVNRDHFWNFANSDLAPEFLMEPHVNNLGVRGLFYGEEGFRHFFTVKEISGLEDLKGMKLDVYKRQECWRPRTGNGNSFPFPLRMRKSTASTAYYQGSIPE